MTGKSAELGPGLSNDAGQNMCSIYMSFQEAQQSLKHHGISAKDLELCAEVQTDVYSAKRRE